MSSELQDEYESSLEKASGKSISYLRDTPIDQQRRDTELKHARPMRFPTLFPLIGRGNVLRDRVVDHESAELALREALR